MTRPSMRPLSASDLALAFSVDRGRLGRIISKHSIGPAFVSGGRRFYGPRQVRRIYTAIQIESARPAAPVAC